MKSEELEKLFLTILPKERVRSSADDLEYYGKDASKQFAAAPLLILLPDSVREVGEILALCTTHSIRVVPSGGRTGYSGGATAVNNEVVISLERMNRVLAVDTAGMTITCEAGITTEALQAKAALHGLYYPVDFTSKGSSQIGGNIATNAGGMRVVRYGNTREWVLGLKVVLASGKSLDLNGKLVKNQTGYDLRHLMIGSEGTLGIIVEATLRLTTPPRESQLCLCAASHVDKVLQACEAVRSEGFTLTLIEYFERSGLELVVQHRPLKDPFTEAHPVFLLVEAECQDPKERERFEASLAKLIEQGILADVVVAASVKQRADLMALRELIGEVANKHYVPHKNDISVPIAAIPGFVKKLSSLSGNIYSGYQTVVFGHIGDGNLHVNVLKPEEMSSEIFFTKCDELDRALFEIVKEFKGSISAEHGVGLLKKPFLLYSRTREEIELMRMIKRAFDPKGILNPGKIVDA